MSTTYIGIDVAKHHLDIADSSGIYRLENNKVGFADLLKRIAALGGTAQCVCESSGGYETAMLMFLSKHGIAVSLVNPTYAKRFIQSLGQKAKTDRIDAEGLRRYGEVMKPRLWQMPCKNQRALHELCRRREEYVSMQSQEKTRMENGYKKDIERHLNFIGAQIKKLEAKIKEIIAGDELLSKRSKVIREIEGCGEVAVLNLLVHLPELGQIGRQELGAIVGLAPYNNDSGQHRGKRMIRGGRKQLRDKLYLPTLTAMRMNPQIREFAQRLSNKGKPFKVVLIACMRKLLIIINAKIKKFALTHT